MTRLKTCGAVERPKQRAKNWKIRQTPWTEESIRNMDASEKADTLPSGWCILLTKARNLILAATTVSTSWYKQNGCNSRAKKEEPDRRFLSEQRLDHLAQGVYPDDAEAKNLHDPASRPNKKRKMDACGRKMSPHEEPPEVRCTYWYHPVAYY